MDKKEEKERSTREWVLGGVLGVLLIFVGAIFSKGVDIFQSIYKEQNELNQTFKNEIMQLKYDRNNHDRRIKELEDARNYWNDRNREDKE